MDAVVSFGGWLERRRKALDLTREELAHLAGCSVSTLRKIETGERRPSKQLAELLASALNIPTDERSVFIRIARGELSIARLKSPPPLPGLDLFQPSQALSSSIPIPPTPLIGRETELAAIRQMLGDPQCRLITLVGPGGIGKTRLAMEVAIDQSGQRENGAAFVPLAGMNSADLIVPAIASALSFRFHDSSEPKKQLLNYLRDKRIFLVLDNLEHILDGIGIIGEIMEYAPRVKVLCTSREQPNLHGEWVFDVRGLNLPDAVALFASYARRIQTDFTMREDNESTIARICRLVEGMPLAIELAAGWIRVLPLTEIEREIQRKLDFLSTNMRDIPEGHRSIQAVFDHSWYLLGREEQQALAKLSVFRGGFSLEAAKQVAGASLNVLSSLVAKSLVQRSESGRYDLHALLRHYTSAKLATDREIESANYGRHSDYYLSFLREQEVPLCSRRQKESLVDLTAESDNIRLALERAIELRKIPQLGAASFALWYFYEIRGWFQEGESIFRQAAEKLQALQGGDLTVEAARQTALNDMQTNQAYFARRLGRTTEAYTMLRHCIERLRELGNQRVLRYSLRYYGMAAGILGQLDEAGVCLHESLELSRAADHKWDIAFSTINLSRFSYFQKAFADAERYSREGLALGRELGDPRLIAFGLFNLGQALMMLGRPAEARELMQECLAIAQETGDRYAIGTTLALLGWAAQTLGRQEVAHALYEKSSVLLREIGDEPALSDVYVRLADLALSQGNTPEAEECLHTAAEIATRTQAVATMLDVLARWATARAQTGASEAALELALFVLRHPSSHSESRDHVEQLRATLEARLTPEQVDAAQARAQTKTFETHVRGILKAN